VERQQVHFLYARSLRMRDADMDVLGSEELADFPASAPGKGDYAHLAFVSRSEGSRDVL
jgi:hypothetical protein